MWRNRVLVGAAAIPPKMNQERENGMTPDLILDQFDRAAKNFVFPMLDNGNVYLADVRLSIFRDPKRWLMIVEVLGVYVPKVSGCDVFQNCLYLFGNHFPANQKRPTRISSTQLIPYRMIRSSRMKMTGMSDARRER